MRKHLVLLAALAVMLFPTMAQATPGYLNNSNIEVDWECAYNYTTDEVFFVFEWMGQPYTNGNANATFAIHPRWVFYTDANATTTWQSVYGGTNGTYDAVGNQLWHEELTWATHAMAYDWYWNSTHEYDTDAPHYFNSRLTWANNSAIIPTHQEFYFNGQMWTWRIIYPASYRVYYVGVSNCRDNQYNYGTQVTGVFAGDYVRACPQGHD
ncbi:MAG: hypothetical protein WC773_01925 [Patescibacteria group bacterium]